MNNSEMKQKCVFVDWEWEFADWAKGQDILVELCEVAENNFLQEIQALLLSTRLAIHNHWKNSIQPETGTVRKAIQIRIKGRH